MPVGLGVGQHDLARERDDFGSIIMLADNMQIVDMADQRRITQTTSFGLLGASPTRQGNELLRGRFDDRNAGKAGYFSRLIEGFGDE